LVKRGATIGANATIVCGTTIGEYSLIGAGAVVTKDVPPYGLALGNPAKRVGWVCKCGVVLVHRTIKGIPINQTPKEVILKCPNCGSVYSYRKEEDLFKPVGEKI